MNTKTRKDTIKNFHKFYDGIKLSQKCLSSYDCLYIFNLSLDCTSQKKGYLMLTIITLIWVNKEVFIMNLMEIVFQVFYCMMCVGKICNQNSEVYSFFIDKIKKIFFLDWSHCLSIFFSVLHGLSNFYSSYII